MDGPDWRQAEEAEQEEQAFLAEEIAWYEARRDQFNQSDEESENEHRNFDTWELWDGEVSEPPQY